MSQDQPKEAPTAPSVVPPPLVSRKEPDTEPARKPSDKQDAGSTQFTGPSVKRDPRGDAHGRNTREPIKQSEEDLTASEKGRDRSRSRSRNRERKNFNRDTRDNRDNREYRDRRQRNDNGRDFDRDSSKTSDKQGRRRDYQQDYNNNKQLTYYKTKMCPLYQSGKCQKEGKCNFAHGQSQLRDLPNFKKTKLCIDYIHGKCVLSSRQCKYAHGETELKRQNYNDFSRDRDRQRERQRQEHQAEMRKYRISSSQPYGFGGMSGSAYPSSGYSHAPTYPTHPPPSAVYNYGTPHGSSWQGHHYAGRSGDAWSGYGTGGAWAPRDSRDNINPTGLTGSFDPVSSAVPAPYYRPPWDYNVPASNVGIGRTDGGMAGPSFSGPLPGSFSSGGFSSAPTHFSSSTSGNSNVYPSGGQFSLSNPPPPSPSSAPTGPFLSVPYHRPSTDTITSSYDSFSMGVGSDMPRRQMPNDR